MIVGLQVSDQPVSRHKCLIYEGHPSEQLPVVVPMMENSLKDNWRCLYLGDPANVSMVGTALNSRGIDTRREADRGALIFSSDRDHLDGGKFEPKAMIDGLCQMIDLAVKDGFNGLWATGDMMWELGSDYNFEYLTEYEALLEQVFRSKPLLGLCQYHKDVLPPLAVEEALKTHPNVYVGESYAQDNLYFMPPEFFLQTGSSKDRDAQAQWMCDQLMRTMKAEQKRDHAMSSLSKSEAKQRKLAGDLAKMNRELEFRVQERTAALEASNKELQHFSYSVSHDLRAPLRAINTYSHYLVEDFGEVLGTEGMEYVSMLRERVSRMNDQIDSMLVLSRITQTEMKQEEIDISEMAATITEELRHAEPDRQIEITIQPNISVRGDKALLHAALENLIGNAWKFTSKKPNPSIEVGQLEAEPGKLVIFVKDNGAGFDMDHAQDLFGTFKRLHSPKDFVGNGIGLATVQRIVARHSGTVWAEAKVDEGATFFISMPDSTP